MAQSNLTKSVEPRLAELAAHSGYELVDVELVREGASRYLRIYIDKPGGITLNDCESYHHACMPMVEEVDYDFLEVCSPGLDRPLKKQKDFDRFAGKPVEVHFYKPLNGAKQMEGTLVGLVEQKIVLSVNGEEQAFDMRDVSLCRPVITFTEADFDIPEDGEA